MLFKKKEKKKSASPLKLVVCIAILVGLAKFVTPSATSTSNSNSMSKTSNQSIAIQALKTPPCPAARSKAANQEVDIQELQNPQEINIQEVQTPNTISNVSGASETNLQNLSKNIISVLKNGVAKNVKAGLLLNASDVSDTAKDYTVVIPQGISTMDLIIWDYAAEDGDYVQVIQNGIAVTDVFMIRNSPQRVTVPAGGIIEIKGIKDGGGGITYAVSITETGYTYFNRAPISGANKYTIVQE